jgi:hypothetical protein
MPASQPHRVLYRLALAMGDAVCSAVYRLILTVLTLSAIGFFIGACAWGSEGAAATGIGLGIMGCISWGAGRNWDTRFAAMCVGGFLGGAVGSFFDGYVPSVAWYFGGGITGMFVAGLGPARRRTERMILGGIAGTFLGGGELALFLGVGEFLFGGHSIV